jgi:3-methyladenine DNA glycosylase AlkD
VKKNTWPWKWPKGYKRFIIHENLDIYERLIREGAWWDFVDAIAAHLVGGALAKEPQVVYPIMDLWINDADMWIRRSAILCQLNLKDRCDQERLFGYCVSRCHEKEFFIRKAIGWALRQYSYVAPQAVKAFLLEHQKELSGLSFREGAKQLVRQGIL